MLKEERYQKILELIASDGKITVGEIVRLFDVSDMTARRDIKILEQSGLLRRVHGGAVSNLGRSYEPPYSIRSSHATQAKKAIGKAAADMILNGDSIVLDVGTTTLQIVRAIIDRRNLTIITASLPIANEIISKFSLANDIRLILAGGIVRARELSMTGHIAQETFSQFQVDKAFIGVGGIDIKSGLTEYNLEDALVKKPLLKTARQKIVVAEGEKLGRSVFATIGSITDIDMIITDITAAEDKIRSFRDIGIEVIIAQ
ncbi:MAG: DeoR/GlpR transcriptional regulator [Anaerolineales bacterium]|nr:MAG: DeoR/GlpR transcriptional regulator [Anaerolineales bacterium]